jgi:hypothetical protein
MEPIVYEGGRVRPWNKFNSATLYWSACIKPMKPIVYEGGRGRPWNKFNSATFYWSAYAKPGKWDVMYLVLGASILPLFTIFLLDYLTVSESIFSSYYITLNIFYCQAIIQKINQTLLINLRGLLWFILFN